MFMNLLASSKYFIYNDIAKKDSRISILDDIVHSFMDGMRVILEHLN